MSKMIAATASTAEAARIAALSTLLARQKAAVTAGVDSAETRIGRLTRCIGLLSGHAEELCQAMANDFGWRSRDASMLTDVAASIGTLKHARKHVRTWMRADHRPVEFPLSLLGAKAEIQFQPKGVVGVIAPWNFPVFLCFAPLAGVLAAGNRAMIKPSELTLATSDLLSKLIKVNFDEEELAVVVGGRDIGAAFARLPFDHIMFTGGADVAREVMAAAAENLTPVTLELGGKSPVILSKTADLTVSAARVMAGKTLNAGQVCLAPDYLFAPHDKIDAFVECARAALATLYPKMKENPDYSGLIDQRRFERLMALLNDAKAKGARVIEINPAREDFAQQPFRKMAPALVLNVTDDMALMQEEIFGPILPIRSYQRIDEAIEYINRCPPPLALYYFGGDEAEIERVLRGTRSGGVTINDVIYHLAQNDLPFGGVGASGMGRYQGREGFLEFSNQRAVYRQARSEIISRLRPPYGEAFRDMMRSRLRD